jgi:hypothetical protein
MTHKSTIIVKMKVTTKGICENKLIKFCLGKRDSPNFTQRIDFFKLKTAREQKPRKATLCDSLYLFGIANKGTNIAQTAHTLARLVLITARRALLTHGLASLV